jgi:hypothetical protein
MIHDSRMNAVPSKDLDAGILRHEHCDTSFGPERPIVQKVSKSPSGKEFTMLKIFAVLLLGAFGLTLAGCHASADVDPHSSSSLMAPQ